LRTVFTGGTVVDGSGADPAVADVVVEGGRIVEVGAGLDGDVAVDCTGGTVVPGFFDCHVHAMFGPRIMDLAASMQTPWSLPFFEAVGHLGATLAQGVTTVRDAGGADLGLKEAVARGLVQGPRMQISISILSQTGGHADGWMVNGCQMPLELRHPGAPPGVVDGPEAMRVRVREVLRAGADVIKVCTSGGVLSPRDDPRHGHYRDAELAVVAEEVAAVGKGWMAHAQATDGIKAAVRNGVRSIEHGIYLDDEAIAMMLDRGTWLVPTLVAPHGVLDARDAGIPVPEAFITKTELVMEAHAESVRRAAAAGVKIAMGTDSGVCPHGQNLRELALMRDCGMTPMAVLEATTRVAAELLGVADDRGTLEPGKRADLVVVAGDALALDDLGSRIEGVWMDGERVV
jgi:imidazolonepropionase-like amidohydrolase